MKSKILEALKTRFASLGFGDKAFEGVADYLATTITEEENIETGINGVEGLLKSFQGDIDKRVTDAVNKAKKEKPTAKPGEKPVEQPTPENVKTESSEISERDKFLIDQIKALTDKIQSIESGNRMKSYQEKIRSTMTEKNIPEKYYSRIVAGKDFESDDQFNEFVGDVEKGWKDLEQDLKNDGLKSFGPPKFGNRDAKKEASKDEAKSIVDDLMKN